MSQRQVSFAHPVKAHKTIISRTLYIFAVSALVFALTACMNSDNPMPARVPPAATPDSPMSLVGPASAPTQPAAAPILQSSQSDEQNSAASQLEQQNASQVTPLPNSGIQELKTARTSGMKNTIIRTAIPDNSIPIYNSFDFLTAYLGNQTYPYIVEGRPWDFGSTNMAQFRQPNGGTSYWDYWSEAESWNSPNHLWFEDNGRTLSYATEAIKDSSGKKTTAYILLDRDGPGVMDKLWFTHDPTRSFLKILTQLNLYFTPDPPEVTEWGSLAKLGNLRIEVDRKAVYDGPIQNWFSGDAQQLPSLLRQIFVWRYGQFGSDGNIIPIPYQDHIKVEVYGGVGKPKWFMATGMTFPSGTLVQSYSNLVDLNDGQMAELADNVLRPESYLQTLPSHVAYDLTAAPGTPAALTAQGAGAISAMQIRISKQYDPRQLWLRVFYGTEKGIDLPLLAFFGDPNDITLHRSAPIGIIDAGDSYLLYSNMPLPYQNGIAIAFDSIGGDSIPIHVDVATTDMPVDTRLQALFDSGTKLAVYGPDYTLDLPGNGKLVGLVLVTRDQIYDSVPRVVDKKTGDEDFSKRRWPMGYLEGNLTMSDGNGVYRYYSGQEDWAEGGYYFNSGYTTPPGGSNRPFGCILRYSEGKDGYATLFRYFNDLSAFRYKNGLHLSFGHGTWNNNFPVTYGATILYYYQVPGVAAATLPASNYSSVNAAPPP